MPIRQITVYGEPVLHTRAVEVTQFDDELRQLVADMHTTMDAAHGVGLAAPQVGLGLRMFTYVYADQDDAPERGVVINPRLTLSTKKSLGWGVPGNTWLPGTDEDPFGH